jgi:hypothetical protein
MLGQAESRRLVATFILSVALHLILLTLFHRGLPGSGGPQSSATQSVRLKVSFVPLGFLADSLVSSVTEQALKGVGTDESVSRSTEDIAGLTTTETGYLGLPISEEMGPPYPPPMPTYLPSSMLERPPQPLTNLDERFAKLEGVVSAGRMVFSLLINEDGKVDEVLNEYSSLSQEFVATVQAALDEMRFQPGVKDGCLVKSRARIEVNFSYSIF